MNTEPVHASVIDDKIDVRHRLQLLLEWQNSWKEQVRFLDQKIGAMDKESLRDIDLQKAAEIDSLRRRIELQQVKVPFEISPEIIKAVGYGKLRKHLVEQFVQLSKEERLLWMNNFLFIMTPDIRKLNDKIGRIRAYRSFGQQRNFLLGGLSGMGKTTYLDWFTSNYIPSVERERNYVPIIKMDAPEGSSVKELLRRMIVACGANYLERDTEGKLLQKVSFFFQRCGVEVVIIDEVEHIKSRSVRRRVLEVSNMTYHIPIICASCEPHMWVEGDSEVEGRWNDYFRLEPYTGKRLEQLLSFLNLLLPFAQNSFLRPAPKKRIASSKETNTSEQENDSAEVAFIEEVTKGKLGNIMLLIREASKDAIVQDLPYLNKDLLQKTWGNIQTRPAKVGKREKTA